LKRGNESFICPDTHTFNEGAATCPFIGHKQKESPLTKAITPPQPEFPTPLSNSPDIASNEARLLYLDALRGLIMIAYWAGGLVLLYLLCDRYRKFKQSTASNSVWRFF
jgi:hypothetical protein